MLVIIGLLVGGVLTGRDLIETSTINKIGKDFQEHLATIQTFYGKFHCYPGDCRNATSYWPDVYTLDGDQDGRIIYFTEARHTWQHIGLARLSSNYDIIPVGTTAMVDPGVNVPEGPLCLEADIL